MRLPPFLDPHTRAYSLPHAPIPFYFRQSSRDFVVDEIPLYPFSGSGEHLIVKVRKKGLTTWELVQIFSEHLGVKARDIGYAGLKDKQALTIQHLSLPKSVEERLGSFAHEAVKILEVTRHENKLRLGHLKGNTFFIRLKKVQPVEAQKLAQALERLGAQGMPNFFGYQRFGRDGDNHETGRALMEGRLLKQPKSRRQREFLLSAYQSWLFNAWLNLRLQLSHVIHAASVPELAGLLEIEETLSGVLHAQENPFVLLPGELMHHYPHGRVFAAEMLDAEALRFAHKEAVPTGPITGERLTRAQGVALEVESPFTQAPIPAPGSRRFAWVFPEIHHVRHLSEEAWVELQFTLPKGCYATVLLEELAKREIRTEGEDEHEQGD